MTSHSLTSIKFAEYYDENFIEAILSSKTKAVQYFCEEYYVESKWQKEEFLWMFPFLDKLTNEEKADSFPHWKANGTRYIAIRVKGSRNEYEIYKQN